MASDRRRIYSLPRRRSFETKKDLSPENKRSASPHLIDFTAQFPCNLYRYNALIQIEASNTSEDWVTMASSAILNQATQERWPDEEVVNRVLAGETPLYEILMRRYNQRLYRVARAILRNDAEAEDVMQDAYVRAYQHLADFEGRAKFSTWLTRIAVYEALARSRRHSRFQSLDNSEESGGEVMRSLESTGRNPEEAAYDRELGGVLEQAILQLPEEHRFVFMLRDVEGMSTDETAECLNLSPENVKVRLHRARAGLRKDLSARVGATTVHSFQLHAARCDRVAENVFKVLGLPE